MYQQKLEKDINNYKEEYLNIEIEIIPSESNLTTFIEDWDKKGYFHYFINDNKEELKRNYILKMDNAKKIKVKIGKEVKSFSKLFKDCVNNKSIKFVKFNRKDIEDMSYMFQGCLSLEELDISKMKTNNVKNMEYMFDRCESLKKLKFSNFKTDNVTNMIFMFRKCRKLKEIEISNLKTKNVKDMSYMFSECSSLEELNISNFETDNVEDMSFMFNGCQSLKKLIFNFNTSNVFERFNSFNKLHSENI